MQQLRALAVNRYRRHALAIWQSRGGGFYGFVAMLTFLYIEALDLAGSITGLSGFRIDLGTLISWLVNNFVQVVVNGVRAAIWPAEWISRFGIGVKSALLLGGCYAAYRAVRPAVIRLLTPTDELLLERTRS
jgi:hypothetical protein